MKLRTPVTGAVVDVADEKVEKYLGRGFQRIEPQKKPKAEAPVEEPKPKAKKSAKKE